MTPLPPSPDELARLLPRVLTDDEANIDAGAALTLYLFLPVKVDGINYRSSLEALLRDARGAAGRDPDSGEIEHPDRSRSWLGAIGYMSLVDQMSKLLAVPVDGTDPDIKAASTFERLLIWDGDVMPDEAAAIYALRCAFVHSYGLLNDPRSQARFLPINPDETDKQRQARERGEDRDRSLLHMFHLTAEGYDVVRLGYRLFPIDSSLSDIGSTRVDLRSLDETVERLIGELRAENLAGRGLGIRADVPMPTFTRACFFQHRDEVDTKPFVPTAHQGGLGVSRTPDESTAVGDESI